MSSLVFLAVAYAIVWLMLFGYLLSLAFREKELRREVKLITQVLEEREAESASASAPAVERERYRAEASAIEITEPSAAT